MMSYQWSLTDSSFTAVSVWALWLKWNRSKRKNNLPGRQEGAVLTQFIFLSFYTLRSLSQGLKVYDIECGDGPILEHNFNLFVIRLR